jgi:DNA-binding FadR family transcriptional regulator
MIDRQESRQYASTYMISSERDGSHEVTFDRPRLHEQVLSHMTQLIADGPWTAGVALPAEGELAQQFKVSRTIIRECVRVLASRGMLDVRQGRGIYVTPHPQWKVTESLALLVRSDHSSLVDWLEVRTLLEMDSAQLAAERAAPLEVDGLYSLVEQQLLKEDDPAGYRSLDITFHLALAQATHNAALVRLLEGVIQPLRVQLEERKLTSLTRHASTQEHRDILDRVRHGDTAGARAAMAEHLGRVAGEIGLMMHKDP